MQLLFNCMAWHGRPGVTIPSQQRYVGYYEQMIKAGPKPSPVPRMTCYLRRIMVHTVPHFDEDSGCDPYFVLRSHHNGKTTVTDQKQAVKGTVPHQYSTANHFDITLECELAGDVKVELWDYDKYSKVCP